MFVRSGFNSGQGFSWQIALNCALASQLSYGNTDDVLTRVQQWGFEACRFISVDNTQGFVASDSNNVLVTFRGSQELGDWLSNLKVVRTENPPNYGKVHLGFYQGFDCVREELIDSLLEVGAKQKKIWVTGHSLGGAIATVMAAEFIDQYLFDGVYTFGQPRVVNRKARSIYSPKYDGKFFRVVNDDDVVPRLPPLLKHVGSILWIDNDGSLKEAPKGVRSDDFGPAEFTEYEFEQQQHEFRLNKKRINTAHEGVYSLGVEEISKIRGGGDGMVRGILPSVRDHFMDNYIRIIQPKIDSSA